MYKDYAAIRDAAGYTDADVARENDIPLSTIYDWKQRAQKREAASMSAKTLAKIAKFLKVSIDDIL